jgi:hypothetical protein
MIPPGTINHVHTPLVFDESVLDKGPPHCIERAPGHTVKFFDALLVPLVQMIDNTEEPASIIIRNEFAVVLLCDSKISPRVHFSGGRGVNCGDLDAMLRKVRL